MKKLIIEILGIAIFTIACNKSKNQEFNNIEDVDYAKIGSAVSKMYSNNFPNQDKKSRSQVNFTNSINQFDFIGKMHNIGLNSFVNNFSQIPGCVTNGQLNFNTVINSNSYYFGSSNSLNQFNTTFTQNSTTLRYLKSINTKSNASFISELTVSGFTPSNDFKNYYLKILTTIDLIQIDDENSFAQMIASMKILENSITTSNLPSTEKDLLLGTSAIARYSAEYWFYKTSIDFWDANNVDTHPLKQIIKMDVAGGVGGGAAGAIAGGTVAIPAFGIGAVPGWVAGAITGAVGGSVGQAVFEFLDWLFG